MLFKTCMLLFFCETQKEKISRILKSNKSYHGYCIAYMFMHSAEVFIQSDLQKQFTKKPTTFTIYCTMLGLLDN